MRYRALIIDLDAPYRHVISAFVADSDDVVEMHASLEVVSLSTAKLCLCVSDSM